MKPSKYIISGGGTGGHIYPAIAIADAIKAKQPEAKIVFVGAYGKMEMEKMPQAGYRIHGIWISGLQRAQLWRNVLFPIKLAVSLFQAFVLWLRYRPNVLIGTGGFASGPMLLWDVCWGVKPSFKNRIPTLGLPINCFQKTPTPSLWLMRAWSIFPCPKNTFYRQPGSAKSIG